MSDIKLTYFNARGRVETARLILAHAGNDDDDDNDNDQCTNDDDDNDDDDHVSKG